MHVRELLLKKMIWNKAPALKIHPRSREGRQKQQLAVVVFFASLKLGEDWNFIVNYLVSFGTMKDIRNDGKKPPVLQQD